MFQLLSFSPHGLRSGNIRCPSGTFLLAGKTDRQAIIGVGLALIAIILVG